jgi:DNA-damage-inducible protein J
VYYETYSTHTAGGGGRMVKSAMLCARMEPELKEEVDKILNELGLTTTQAVTLFYQQVRLQRGLPFEVKIPNEETAQTFRDSDAGRNLHHYESKEEMYRDLEL